MAAQTGQVAYEGYKHRSRGVSLVSGDDLPEWGDLPDEIRQAWQASADAVERELESRSPGEDDRDADLTFAEASDGNVDESP